MAASKEPEIDPRRDLTPFVQGIYHSASFLGIIVCLHIARTCRHHNYYVLSVGQCDLCVCRFLCTCMCVQI